MERTIMEIDRERRDFERKRNVLRKIMERTAATATEEKLLNCRQLMSDYEAKITELADELNEIKARNGLVV